MSPEPFLIKPTPNYVIGTVKQIRQNLGSTQIPFDHIVLSAKGTAATTMLNNVQVGDTIKVSQEVRHLIADCSANRSGIDWTKSYAGISGNWVFLRDGVIQYGIDSTGDRHPRTAIGLNGSYVFYLVVDGRQPGYSIGMTIDELAEFFKYTLDATWACNQDGGGSSTMVVNGTVMNSPSDGSPRSVANGMLMCNLLTKSQSTTFSADETVQTTGSAYCRLGPGTNYASIATIASGTQGTIQDHNLKGVYAKGYYWWKVAFPTATGWVTESLLGGSGGSDDVCFTNNDLETSTSGVATDWTASGSSATYSASTDRYSGAYSQEILWTTSGSKVSAIYQRVWVKVGVQYSVRAYFRMNDSNRVNGTIRVDYSGGTDPNVCDVIYSSAQTEWGIKTATFTKTTGSDGWATVFFGGYGSSVQANDWCRVDLITPACTAQGPTTCHVDSIVLSTVNGSQGKKFGRATVTIKDDTGNPVPDATVTGDFTRNLPPPK